MRDMPRAPQLDSTLSLKRDPYHFISRTAERLGSDVFATRVLFHETICMTGPEAAQVFYDEDHFMRREAPPPHLQHDLIMTLMTAPRIAELGDLTERELRRAARRWIGMDQVVLYPEAREVLCRAVCAWAGVPLEEDEVARRTRELSAFFEGAGAIGSSQWAGRLSRWHSEHWARDCIEAMRAGKLDPPAQSALRVIAGHRDLDDRPLACRVAAAELLNVLHPTIAVAVYVTYVAHALHAYPSCRERLARGGEQYLEWFVHEVRRFYPFFPSAMARVRHAFEWSGWRFPRGARALLDLHGIDHDRRIWGDPEVFRPERFAGRPAGSFELVTIELMKRTLRFLCREIAYDLPPQDLGIDEQRLPALPRSGFVMSVVRTLVRPTLAVR